MTSPPPTVVSPSSGYSSDAFHHGKEEGLLFPELGNHGLQPDVGRTAVMLSEHGEGRVPSSARMAEAIGDARGSDAAARAPLLAARGGYVDLIRSHRQGGHGAVHHGGSDDRRGRLHPAVAAPTTPSATAGSKGRNRGDLVTLAGSLLERYPQG